jgi:hypothetical protein
MRGFPDAPDSDREFVDETREKTPLSSSLAQRCAARADVI